MRTSRTSLTLGLILVCAALTLSLAVHARGQTVTFLAQFQGAQISARGVTQATDGNFYGTTEFGGAHDKGQLFRMTPSGELTTVYSFCSQSGCADGSYPTSAPVVGGDGNLYGVTSSGGNSTDSGIFYRMTLDGQIATLYSFCPNSGCADGQYPQEVVLAGDGNFYGTTTRVGTGNGSTIFAISPAGKFKLVYTFCSLAGCIDGIGPQFAPIQGSDGNLYGAAFGGGATGGGVFYELTPQGRYRVLYNFCNYSGGGCDSGSFPLTIVQDADGNFFGTTAYGGGVHNDGTIFEITAEKRYRTLHKFDNRHGGSPVFGLTLANDGNFYGSAGGGPNSGNGIIFEITPKGEYSLLFTFQCCNGGYDPWSPLFQGTDGLLYGTTLYNYDTCCYGTIFSLDNGLSPLVETVPVAGRVGQRVLILGNNLTGTSSVTFNGVAASFTVESDTYIKATVPTGATTGTVSVTTPSGTLNSNPQFVVTK